MTFYVGAITYFPIECPDVSKEDFENGDKDKIIKQFWKQMREHTLPEGEIIEIENIEMDEDN